MNSDTHSCTHSLASFAIFALSGNAAFMIRPTFAIYPPISRYYFAHAQPELTGRYRSCSLYSSICASVNTFGSIAAAASAASAAASRDASWAASSPGR